MKRLTRRYLAPAAAVLAIAALWTFIYAGCGADEATQIGRSDTANGGGSTGVGQSGAQDFGRFRGIIESGEIPAPETLDAVGFFNEHKFSLPEAECGETVCLHGMFGVQGNMINGSNCTTVGIGFNTKMQPGDVNRPPLNLAVAVDVSGSMTGQPINAVRDGLEMMADELQGKDRVTLIAYSDQARVVFESTPVNDQDRSKLKQHARELSAGGSTNIYGGLRQSLETVGDGAQSNWQNRVILLSDGKATAGITNDDRIINLGKTWAERGIGLTTIGVGREFDLSLMRRLSHNGAGNFYFLEDPQAVEEVFVEEVSTFLVPLAEDVRIHFKGEKAYSFRAAYGTRTWTGDEESASIQIPALFMAGREDDSDTGPGDGRRGGGGMILLELVPTAKQEILEETPPGSKVGEIEMVYTDPKTGEQVKQTKTVRNPLRPDAAPEVGEFTSPTVEKAFVALNIYAGFKMATRRAQRGAAGSALDILEPLAQNVRQWNNDNEDTDIRLDLELMDELTQLIERRAPRSETRVGQPPNPWPRD